MRLKIGAVFNAVLALDTIIRERRPMPQLGKFRVARMHAKLLPEFTIANVQRDALIVAYGEPDGGQYHVLPQRLAEFEAEWAPIAAAEIEVDIEPLRLADLALDGNGAIEAAELVLLGDLVTE